MSKTFQKIYKNISKYKFLIFMAIFGLILFFWPQKAQAQIVTSSHLVISEIYYDATGDDAKEEWLEIYNPLNSIVDISGYQITDLSAFFTFPEESQINRQSFIVIAKNKAQFELLYDFSPDYVSLPFSMNNDGDQIILKNNLGELVDFVVYEDGEYCIGDDCFDSSLEAPTGYSLERVPANIDTTEENFITQKYPSPGTTPVELEEVETGIGYIKIKWWPSLDFNASYYEIYISQNPDEKGDLVEKIDDIWETSFIIEDLKPSQKYYIRVKTVSKNEKKFAYSESLEINTPFKPIYSVLTNELLPRPKKGGDFEFIELYNSGTEDVDLSGWFLDDGVGGSNPYQIPAGTIIRAKGYLVFYKTQTKLTLNDTGDQARLFWPNMQLISSSKIYKKAPQNYSWSQVKNKTWQWTTKPTPGKKNIIIIPTGTNDNPQKVNISQVKNLKKGAFVQTEGIVTALPGLFSKYYFYIQDTTSGIQIYYSKAKFPNLKLGSKVRIIGEISEISGEKRIKIKSGKGIKLLGESAQIQPKTIKTAEAKNHQGELVYIQGTITKSSGSTFYISDGSGTIRIYVSSKTGIKKPKTKKGDWVGIIGIVSQTKAGVRVMPRFQNDLKIKLKSGTAQKTKSTASSIIEDVLGASKAEAAAAAVDLAKFQDSDYRVKGDKITDSFGWILTLTGGFLLIFFIGYLFFRRKIA